VVSDPSKTATPDAAHTGRMKILFVAGFTPIVKDRDESLRFYEQTLGLPFERDDAYDYVFASGVDGVKHIGMWRLSEAAEACFGTPEWPADLPEPQATIEFDVDDVDAAAEELVESGYTLLHEPKTMPWGQRIVHVLSPEHLLVGLTYTPQMCE
jgi:predicted enzyme related to lactoylglutathione lyase